MLLKCFIWKRLFPATDQTASVSSLNTTNFCFGVWIYTVISWAFLISSICILPCVSNAQQFNSLIGLRWGNIFRLKSLDSIHLFSRLSNKGKTISNALRWLPWQPLPSPIKICGDYLNRTKTNKRLVNNLMRFL